MSSWKPFFRCIPITALLIGATGCDDDTQCTAAACDDGTSATTTSSTTTDGGSSTGGSSTGGSSTGGGGAEGGSTSEWTLPQCDSVKGGSPITFTADDGATLAPVAAPTGQITLTFGLAALDLPGTIVSNTDGKVFVSHDAGCSYDFVGDVPGISNLTAAKGGIAYGWMVNQDFVYRYEADAIEVLPKPPALVLDLQVDPTDASHLFMGGDDGQLYASTDGAKSWKPYGIPAPGGSGSFYLFSISAADPQHAIAGVSSEAGSVTFDGGATWKRVSGTDGATGHSNLFSVLISPVDPEIVWAIGLSIGDDKRHVYRSDDGGESFVAVLEESDATITNGNPFWAHPVDADVLYFEYGATFGGQGTTVYRYDAATDELTSTHNAYGDMNALAFSPADPSFLYLGISAQP